MKLFEIFFFHCVNKPDLVMNQNYEWKVSFYYHYYYVIIKTHFPPLNEIILNVLT